jgi:hydrogenase maturation protease
MKPLCIIGVGSPYGDDQAGWRVIDRLRAILDVSESIARVVIIQTPVDILTLVDDDVDVILIDACQGSGSSGEVQCFNWPDSRIVKLRHALGHGMSLDEALQLAAAIGKAPANCVIWCVEGDNFRPEQVLSDAVATSCDLIAMELAKKIAQRTVCHA